MLRQSSLPHSLHHCLPNIFERFRQAYRHAKPLQTIQRTLNGRKIECAVLSTMESRAYTLREIFQRYRANNGAMNEEKTTSASSHLGQSTNLETMKTTSVTRTKPCWSTSILWLCNFQQSTNNNCRILSNYNAILLLAKYLVTTQMWGDQVKLALIQGPSYIL